MECHHLNKNDPHVFLCMNTWSPVGMSSGEGLGGLALLEELCHKLWVLEFKYSKLFPVRSLFLLLMKQDLSSQPLLQHHAYLPPAAMLPIMMIFMNSSSDNVSTNKLL